MENTDSSKVNASEETHGPLNGMDTKDKPEVSGKRKRDEDELQSSETELKNGTETAAPEESSTENNVQSVNASDAAAGEGEGAGGDASRPTSAADGPTSAADGPTNAADGPTNAADEPTSAADGSTNAADGSTSAADESSSTAGGPSRRSSRLPATPATDAAKKADNKTAKKADDSDSESTTGLGEDEFLVEKILDYVREKGVDMFLIKWKGWSNAYNSWEPQENLSCLEMMINFFKERELAHQNKRRKTEPSLAREGYVQMFEEEHFHPTPDQLEEEFARRAVGGQLKFKDKLKPIKAIHMEIESFVRRSGLRPDNMKALRKVHQLKEQLLQHRLTETRERQLVRLKQWEDDINALCSDSAKITVENAVDLALPPDSFIYKNDYVPGEGVVIPSDPVIGCECLVCYPGTSCCGEAAGASAAYTKNGKLRLQVGQPIYECNKTCRCNKDCFNRVVQKGRKVKLAIFRTSNGCGWGVKALEGIKKGTFVAEYVGEVITNEEAERRGEKYDSVGVTYLFDLDFNDQVNLYTVDAAVYGNVSHFINHSCEPNLIVYGMWSDCLDPNLPRLALFACRDILKGEQLYFDYNSPLGSNKSAKQVATPTAERRTSPATLDQLKTAVRDLSDSFDRKCQESCTTSAEETKCASAASPTKTTSIITNTTPVKAVTDTTPTGDGPNDGSKTPPREDTVITPVSPTKSPRRHLGSHPSARTSCKCGAKACRRYLF